MIYHEYKKIMIQLKENEPLVEVVDAYTAAQILGISLSSFQTYISRRIYSFDIIKLHIHNYYIKTQVEEHSNLKKIKKAK